MSNSLLASLFAHLTGANANRRKDVAPTNPRGIPYAPFVDKVEDYVSSRAEVETTLKSFQEMISYVSTDPPPACGLMRWPGNINSWKRICNGEQPG